MIKEGCKVDHNFGAIESVQINPHLQYYTDKKEDPPATWTWNTVVKLPETVSKFKDNCSEFLKTCGNEEEAEPIGYKAMECFLKHANVNTLWKIPVGAL